MNIGQINCYADSQEPNTKYIVYQVSRILHHFGILIAKTGSRLRG